MTQLRTVNAADLAHLSRALVGFDRYFNAPSHHNGNYPPHNIVKYDETHYGIEIAVSGFSREEITVEVDQDQLTVKGCKLNQADSRFEYLHRGLAARDFEQQFTLAEYMEVNAAEVKDGMLVIEIMRIIPDALKPRQIKIK
jgi:molecular chaperone IbpA